MKVKKTELKWVGRRVSVILSTFQMAHLQKINHQQEQYAVQKCIDYCMYN